MVDRCGLNRRSHGYGRLPSGFLPAVVSPPGLLLTFTGLLEAAIGEMLPRIRPLPVTCLICPSLSPAVPITLNPSSRACGPASSSARSPGQQPLAAPARPRAPGSEAVCVRVDLAAPLLPPSRVGGAGRTCSIWISPFELLSKAVFTRQLFCVNTRAGSW